MAAGKTSPSLLHAREPQKRMFLPQKNPCGNLEDLTKLITCQKATENFVFAETKTPAAAGKTSPSLQDIGKSKDRHFGACGSREGLARQI